MNVIWKKGRGKLGNLQPLIGLWIAEADSPMGPLRCTRRFEPMLNGAYVRLEAEWRFGGGTAEPAAGGADAATKPREPYREMALFGAGPDGKLCFWSFTSDGKNSQGTIADVTDLHPEAVGFEAQMSAGLARQAYWPDGEGGFFWVVESKTKKGWNRFVRHQYRRSES